MHPAGRTRGASTVGGVLSLAYGQHGLCPVFVDLQLDLVCDCTDERCDQFVRDGLHDDSTIACLSANQTNAIVHLVEHDAVRRCESILPVSDSVLATFDEIIERRHGTPLSLKRMLLRWRTT